MDGGKRVQSHSKKLAAGIEAELSGDPNITIHSASTLEDAGPGQVSFLSNPKYVKQIETTNATAVIVAPGIASDRVALLKAKDPLLRLRPAPSSSCTGTASTPTPASIPRPTLIPPQPSARER